MSRNIVPMRIPAIVGGILTTLCAAAIGFAGCVQSEEALTEQPQEPIAVYSDGVYLVEAGLPEIIQEGDPAVMEITLRITNGSLEDMAVSSVLGITVSADGVPCEVLTVPKKRTPIDGLIAVGECAEGRVRFAAPSDAAVFDFELAADYLDDQWIAFSVDTTE